MKVGFTCSSFDLLHPGHVLMLEDCKNHCDYLIVGFNTLPEGKNPTQSVYERYVQLNAIKYVDEIIPYNSEEDLMQILLSKKIDIRFIGEDKKGTVFTGSNLDMEYHYNPRRHKFSTTELRQRIKNT